MKRNCCLTSLSLYWLQWSVAQAPKWVDKAKRAVFSVVTYDKNDKILNTGDGFFVTEDGVAASDDYLVQRCPARCCDELGRGTDAQWRPLWGPMTCTRIVRSLVFGDPRERKSRHCTLAAVVSGCRCGRMSCCLYSTQKDRSLRCREERRQIDNIFPVQLRCIRSICV